MSNIEYLYRYTSLESLALILKSRQIRLNPLDKMDDLQEQKTADVENLGKFVFISSWTEGSFQSIWNGPSKDKFQPLWNRFATSIYHDGTLHLFFVTYMQGYLLVLYLGGVFYYAFTYKRMGDGATLGLYAFLYFFGGILFHLISETKSQYTLPYIYLQIPMIAAGYNHMTQILSRYLKNRRKSS